MAMRWLVTFIFLLFISGCASVPIGARQEKADDREIACTQQAQKIEMLKVRIAEQEAALKEKDKEIDALKEKLRSFGVF